ncbi:MAG: CHASE2 domain-containing protein [Cyanobacteria bacterium P01_A01_bin.116]
MIRPLSNLLSELSSDHLKKRPALWRELILPGTLIIGLVCCIRLLGLLQVQEWMALDKLSRQCPLQPPDDKITLISIDEADYQALGEFPISNQILAQALSTLQQYQPRVIGLDIFKDLTPTDEKDTLQQQLLSMPNVVTTEVAFSADSAMNILPPVGLPPQQVGFADIMTDSDGKIRRASLAASASDNSIKYSFPIQLTRQYLKTEGFAFHPGDTATDPIGFGSVVLSKFYPNSGGYIRADATGNQILMNFCMLQRTYETLTLRDLLAGRVNAERLRDRLVIIGNMASSTKDSFITDAIRSTLYSQRIGGSPSSTKLIYGAELHAHTVKQILSSSIDRPCTLKTWPDPIEYLWIASWGLLGIALSVLLMSPWKSILSLSVMTLCLLGMGYQQLNNNLWIPIVPTALSLCGAGLITAFFDREMRFELAQKKIAVDRTYDEFHNGPFQRLAVILRKLGGTASALPSEQHQQLQDLNIEMRSIFERMRQETNEHCDHLYLIDNTVLDLQEPLPDLLYQVYDVTLKQELPGFADIKVYIYPNFSTLSSGRFSLMQKRNLCVFLQENLINIGKYGIGATRIDVICTEKKQRYRLQIIDNGTGFSADSVPMGKGTAQAIRLSKQLKGTFRRVSGEQEGAPAQGVLCELAWPKRRFVRRRSSC